MVIVQKICIVLFLNDNFDTVYLALKLNSQPKSGLVRHILMNLLMQFFNIKKNINMKLPEKINKKNPKMCMFYCKSGHKINQLLQN